MAPSEKEEKMQVAFEKKETALTKLQQWLNGVASIISTKSDKDTASINLTHLNESFEDYKIAYMEYIALMEDEDEMDKIKAHYDELKDKLEQARTDLGNYLHQFDHEKVDNHENTSQTQDWDKSLPNIEVRGRKYILGNKNIAMQLGKEPRTSNQCRWEHDT